jgi:hypothetical protein
VITNSTKLVANRARPVDFGDVRATVFIYLLLAFSVLGADRLRLVRPAEYSGMCDASGAVALSSNLFAVASDEDNILRVYRSDKPGKAVSELDVNQFLAVRGKSLEADLEAAARIGDRAYWIGSHGHNKNGKERTNRCRFFATDIKVDGDQVALTPVGQPYENLRDDLIQDPKFAQYRFAQAAALEPKAAGALNIEGLAATPQGTLLIGFRNPIPKGQAILVPLLNPDDVIQGKAAKLGAAIELDLGGLGVRDIALWGNTYIIVAGSYKSGGNFQFYRWSGPGTPTESIKVKHLGGYNPEAIIIYPETGLHELQILSDDGTKLMDGCPCKELEDSRKRTFRSFWLVE